MPTAFTQPLADGEFGYRPAAEEGVVERRRRKDKGGLWSEIAHNENGPGYVVRSQFGTVARNDDGNVETYPSISTALEAAKSMEFCEQAMEALENAEQEAQEEPVVA